MNATDPAFHPVVAKDSQVKTRKTAKALFPVESLQHLDAASALRCQIILGHGSEYGIWVTQDLAPYITSSHGVIDLRRRLKVNLPDNIPHSPRVEALIEEGVLYLTRLALLMRMGPASLGVSSRGAFLDVTTIAGALYQPIALLVARGIVQHLSKVAKLDIPVGFVSALTSEDLVQVRSQHSLRINLNRINALHSRGLWPDAPAAKKEFKEKITVVRGNASVGPQERKRPPFLPIADDYMAQMGPRVLWLIKDLGPNLIRAPRKTSLPRPW